ncbi:xanthine dehydrogenase family protein subunit M [Arsenicitalea aurantiaca]|uniref:Xanthine dehydrogenase family protein subunit M n=1 Tax=Arsenicitalea aurantiaca TaxID=1783274 RepID=A0A433X497_9HYPH|nr:xanthine dehydrogenase family protein subunit M [Arsenicitalea aurantiaca]RUT28882.1 xanthine dehydrogenase family protein subunit M [Arsenicitalea aurantiaca]
MYEFSYLKPETLEAARSAFEAHEGARYMLGGHTLLPAMKARLAAPEALIDLAGIPELKGIGRTGGTISIGAAETHFDVSRNSELHAALPALAALAGSIGDPQVRHRGTIGGSLANNDPAADYPSALLALAGTVRTDRRAIPADDYLQGLYETALEEGEIVTRIDFPVVPFAAYAKFLHPASRYPMVGVFVARHEDGEIRVAVTGSGSDGVFRCTEIEAALEADFSADALEGLALDPDLFMSDIHGSADYRAALVPVMARRALRAPGTASIYK